MAPAGLGRVIGARSPDSSAEHRCADPRPKPREVTMLLPDSENSEVIVPRNVARDSWTPGAPVVSRRNSDRPKPNPGEVVSKMAVHDLKAGFGESQILKGITLPIEERHVTAVIGPSGCGKSTFVRCLNR